MNRAWTFISIAFLIAGCVQPAGIKLPEEDNLTAPGRQQQQESLFTKPDDRDVGLLNHEYLQPEPHDKIIVEIDFAEGHEPAQAAKSRIFDFFSNVAGKRVTFSGWNAIKPSKDIYSASDLLETEKANRNHYTGGDTAVAYFLFLNGRFESEGALGVAYKASSAAVFPDRMNDATSALVLYPQIEKAVVMHELGHLMGLVNINYKSGRDHEDAAHPHHSRNEGSVMYWAVEDISLKQLLNFGPPSDFDDDDLFDLQKIREGVY